MLRLLVKRLQRRPSAMVAQFHGSTVILGGRWGGEQSLDAQPRDLSRRQKKRKREALAVKTNTVNKSKQKLKDNFVTSQIKTPEFESLLTAQDPA